MKHIIKILLCCLVFVSVGVLWELNKAEELSIKRQCDKRKRNFAEYSYRLEGEYQKKDKRSDDVLSKENALNIQNLTDEKKRMMGFAKTAHKKCPTETTLRSRKGIDSDIDIPAYPHLSDIYVHILPAMSSSQGRKFATLTEGKVRKVITNPKINADDVFLKLQGNSMTSFFIKTIENTLAYCGADKNGQPLRVKIVDKMQHSNLEQKDALTIVVAPNLDSYYFPSRYNVQLYTAQYIPRWRIFPKSYTNLKNKIIYTYNSYRNDPFSFVDLYVRVMYGSFFDEKKSSGELEDELVLEYEQSRNNMRKSVNNFLITGSPSTCGGDIKKREKTTF